MHVSFCYYLPISKTKFTFQRNKDLFSVFFTLGKRGTTEPNVATRTTRGRSTLGTRILNRQWTFCCMVIFTS